MIDIKFNTSNHDLQIIDGDLVFIDGVERVAQHVKIRVLFFFEDWKLDKSQGIDYYNEVFGKLKDKNRIDTIIQATILDTPDVESIIDYNSTFDNSLRKLTITTTVKSSVGEVTVEVLV